MLFRAHRAKTPAGIGRPRVEDGPAARTAGTVE
jgi:hypothetical protein